MIKKYITYSIGLLILYLGIPLIVHGSLGADPLTCFVYIISTIFELQLGTMLTLVNIVFLIIHFIRFRNVRFILIGFVASLIAGLIVNFGTYMFGYIPNGNYILKIIIFLVGFIMLAFGIAVIQKSSVQKMPYEGSMEVIASIVKKDINFIRVFVEVGFAIVALIIFLILKTDTKTLFEFFNVGTVFIMLLTGPCVHVMYKKILKGE